MKLHPHLGRTQRKRHLKAHQIIVIQPGRKERISKVSLDGLRVVEEFNTRVDPWWATAARDGFTSKAAQRFKEGQSTDTNYRLTQNGID